METSSALLAFCEWNLPVTDGLQRPTTRSFEFFFDLRLNKRLSKQSRRRGFDTPSRGQKYITEPHETLIYWEY